jgi:TPR repeat protein
MPYYTLYRSRRPNPDFTWQQRLTELDAGVAAYGKREYQTALKLLGKPLENGDAEAQFFVGRLYREGRGVVWDTATAMRLFRLAADQGYPRAISAVGYDYDHGIGVPQDIGKAISWYSKAVAANDPGALNNLAILYAEGCGVDRDHDHARRL